MTPKRTKQSTASPANLGEAPTKSAHVTSNNDEEFTPSVLDENDSLLDGWEGFCDDIDLEGLTAVADSESLTARPSNNEKRLAAEGQVRRVASPKTPPQKPTDPSKHAVERIRELAVKGDASQSYHFYQQYRIANPNWDLAQPDLLALSNALYKAQQWDFAVPLMEHFLQRFPNSSSRTSVKLAGVYVEVQRRPRAALKLLKDVSRKSLPGKFVARYDAITKLARQLIDMSIEDRDPPA